MPTDLPFSDAFSADLARLKTFVVDAGLVAAQAEWVPLAGGRTNRIWRIGSGKDALVCKLYGADAGSPLFPNDPAAEARIMRHLGGKDRAAGLAAEMVAELATPVGPCLIYRHVPGSAWTPGDPVAGVARALVQLHRLAPVAGLRRVGSGSAALAAQGREILDQCNSPTADLLRGLMPVGSVAEPAGEVLLHGDPAPGNVIVGGDGVTLIDWQCPALGDPCDDLATFLSPAMQLVYAGAPLDAAAERAFLAAYPDPGVVDRLTRLRPWFHWRMAAHCLWKAERGQPGYDAGMGLELAALKALQ